MTKITSIIISEITTIVIWWVGAMVVLAALSAATWAFGLTAFVCFERFTKSTIGIIRLSTARYWVRRMEREGLTACRDEYRRMVAERKPMTPAEYTKIENEDDKKHGGAA